ncbi:hypothetical protein HYPSUDRAFT_768945 [Hypholoma sublateritium FD-334 SS-4]|uniref:Uncharacterized protein n=1 Tax=Hypholoma sublateritium (strain FD-334 SS-4) TaxID=945553 RepID=A0A0D2NWK0_HYPSF|nr:hypothetical protein HYPSUDRAFT_768945 [Hypholoma sublateritium FD-334 SS-4]
MAFSICGEGLCLEVVDKDVIGLKDVNLKPRFIEDTPDDLAHVMQKLSHYYTHLKSASNTLNGSTDKISVSFFEVQGTEPEPGHPRANAVKKKDARNLCKSNVINITVNDVGSTYGFELVNNNEDREALLPVLFYFDNVNFTITLHFPLPSDSLDLSGACSLEKGRPMTIGYGDSPGSNVPPFIIDMGTENDTEVGFFKVFLFRKVPASLYSIQQQESAFWRSRGMKAFAPRPHFDELTGGWGAITVTVIQRKGRPQMGPAR